VIVDKYTKALKYILYKKDFDVSDLAKFLVDNVYNRFGILEV